MSEEKSITEFKNGDILLSDANVNNNVVENIIKTNIEINNEKNSIVINSNNSGQLKISKSDNKFVAVGFNTAYSTDGVNWTRKDSSDWLNSVCYGNNKYVAVGNNCTGYSEDGVNWTKKDFTDTLYSVCYGNNKYVAVGKNGTGYSDDGVNWTRKDFNNFLYSVCYANNKYVAVGNYCTAYSTDGGVNWTRNSFTNILRSVCYANNKYVAVGDYYTAYSTDGINWTGKDFSGHLYSVCYGNNKYVAVGTNCTGYSEDGVNWTGKDFSGYLQEVCYDNNKYVAVGNYCTAYSTDGVNWIKNSFDGDLQSVCYVDLSSNISFNIDSSGNGSLTNNNTSLTLTTIPLHDAYNINCSNIIHYGYPEDSINNYAIGKPVFFTNNTYRLNNNAYTLNKISYQQTEEENILSDDCIYGISLNSSYPFIGVVKEIDKTNNIIIFITHGIYPFTVSNSSNYNIGDIIDYNGNKVTVSDNAPLKNNIVGTCVGKIDNSKIIVFK